MAHAYSPRAVTRAVQAGVRSIEHGNLIDEATARVMKQEGAWLVPTLATYAALADEGQRLGWSAAMMDKLARVRDQGIEAIRIARAHGVPIAFGTDLLGVMQTQQERRVCAARLSAQPGRRSCKARPLRRPVDGPGGPDRPAGDPAPGPTCWWSRVTRRAISARSAGPKRACG